MRQIGAIYKTNWKTVGEKLFAFVASSSSTQRDIFSKSGIELPETKKEREREGVGVGERKREREGWGLIEPGWHFYDPLFLRTSYTHTHTYIATSFSLSTDKP